MRFYTLLIAICLCLITAAHAQTRISANGNTENSKPGIHDNQSAVSSSGSDVFTNVRELQEINDNYQADAYPWLSYDGFRLYFTKAVGSLPVNQIMVSSRATAGDPFSAIHAIIDAPGYSLLCPWLDSTELTMYLSVRITLGNLTTILQRSTRPSIDSMFTELHQIYLIGDSLSGATMAPTLTQNQDELYMWAGKNLDRIHQYRKTGTDTFTYVHEISMPAGTRTGPARLSHDGLNLFLDIIGSPYYGIYQLSRKSLNDTFSLSTAVHVFAQPENYFAGHPAVSGNLKEMVFVISKDDNWANDQLNIAYRTTTALPFSTQHQSGVTLYPNPAHDVINLSGVSANAHVSIYTISGRLIERFIGNGHDCSHLEPGLYMVGIMESDQSACQMKLIIQ